MRINFDTYLNPELKDLICKHLKDHKYEYLEVVPNGDYPIVDDPPLSLAVYTAATYKNDQINSIWIVAGGYVSTYEQSTCPNLSDALNYHIGMLVTRGFFKIIPTDKVIVA